MKALYRVPPDDPVVSAFIPLSTDVIACHGIPASNVYAENPPKSSGKPGALHLPDSPAPVHARKRGRQPKNSSRKAKIHTHGEAYVDRTIFGGGRDYTGSVKRSPSPHPEIGIFIWHHQPREYVFFNLQHARKRACLTCISASHATEVDAS